MTNSVLMFASQEIICQCNYHRKEIKVTQYGSNNLQDRLALHCTCDMYSDNRM